MDAIFGDDHIVFYPDAEALFANVDAGLYRKDHTLFHGLVDIAHIVHIKAQVMGSAVHEVPAVGRVGRVLVLHIGLVKQTEFDQLSLHHLAHFLVVLWDGIAGCEHFGSLAVHVQYGIVYLPLALCEAAVGGDHAGEVSIVIGIFCPHVKEDAIAVFDLLVVLDIVEHAGAETARNDGLIRKAFGAVAHKLVQELRLYLILPYTGLHEIENAAKAFLCDVACLLELGNLTLALDRTEFVHKRSHAHIRMQRVALLTITNEAGVARLHRIGSTDVLIGIEVDIFGLGHERIESLLKLIEPLYGSNA